MEIKAYIRTCIWMIVLVLTMFTFLNTIDNIYAAQNFQAQWGNQTITPETWTQINLDFAFEEPVVVATPEYTTTTNANGIMVWVTNVTNSSFMVRTSDENFNAQDSIMVHYLVMEKGAWTLPGSGIKVEAGEVLTNKYGYAGNYNYCPTDGEIVTFTNSFNNNPLVLSTRTSNNNPSVFGATIQSDVSSATTIGTNQMCIGLSRSKSGAATFSNDEKIHWIAIDEGSGNLGGVEFEVLWNKQDTGDSGGNWINGYGDSKPFTQSWAHSWIGSPNVIIAGQTSIGGADGSWPVIYDTGNTGSIRMFVDESNERSHSGSESGGGFAFNSPGNVNAPPKLIWSNNNLIVGYPTVNEGDESDIIEFYSYKNNTNIDLTCISGNCSQFSDDWIDGSSTGYFSYNIINFTCQDNPVGTYNATYKLTSNEDLVGDLLNVSCQVFKVYADLSVSLLSPNPSVDLEVSQNRTFTLSARVDCIGDPGTNCANISGAVRYNAISLFGDGSDGNLVVNTVDTIVNDYTYLTGNELSGSNILTVDDGSIFNSDDEILIIQMQNGSGNGVAGRYEFAKITSISGNDISVSTPINNSYYSGIFDSTNAQVTQIVRVPQYKDVIINGGASITAKAWDGYSGGIVIFRSEEEISFTGSIDVSEKGYRGGTCGTCSNNDWGTQGEGYLGIGTGVLSANGNGGGGGYGPTGAGGEPGAGGSYGTLGGIGASSSGNDPSAGLVVGNIELNTILFGGGAGAGGDNDDMVPFPEYVDGAGAVIIFSPKVTNANIYANGEAGIYPGSYGGTSGSGAGGSIWISGDEVDLNIVEALGGPSTIGPAPDIGGEGGDGRIRIDYNTLTGSSSNPAIEYSGVVTTGVGIMSLISTNNGDKPLWSLSSNPQSCGLMNQGETCTLNWLINATGAVNTSHLVDVIFSSDVIKVREKLTQNLTVNITDNIIPQFTLISPNDNLKLITGNVIKFNWTVTDDDSNLNCSFYINDIFNKSVNCSTSAINNLSIDITKGGIYNWSLSAKDSDNNTGISSVWKFILIKSQSKQLTKSIKFESLNMYKVEMITKTLLSPITIIEKILTDFISGSRTPGEDWINTTLSENYIGWNNNINKSVNHSISGTPGYKHRYNYIIGME